jgi:hypothetical protein
VLEGDVDAIRFNPTALTISKWQIFKLLRFTQNWHKSMQNHKMYADRPSKDEQLLIRAVL